MKILSLLAVALATVSCASSQTSAAQPASTPAEVAWKDMTKPQRGKYMRAVVVPKMKALFVAFDGKTFADFNCRTCHGPGAEDATFAMPNPDIFVLPKDFAPVVKNKPEWLKFMSTQVKPTMAQLLGATEFDPKNPQPNAFGCHACHTLEGEARAPSH